MVARLFYYPNKKMKKLFTTCMLLTAAASMSAQGNQKIFDSFSIEGTNPEFSKDGKVQHL